MNNKNESTSSFNDINYIQHEIDHLRDYIKITNRELEEKYTQFQDDQISQINDFIDLSKFFIKLSVSIIAFLFTLLNTFGTYFHFIYLREFIIITVLVFIIAITFLFACVYIKNKLIHKRFESFKVDLVNERKLFNDILDIEKKFQKVLKEHHFNASKIIINK